MVCSGLRNCRIWSLRLLRSSRVMPRVRRSWEMGETWGLAIARHGLGEIWERRVARRGGGRARVGRCQGGGRQGPNQGDTSGYGSTPTFSPKVSSPSPDISYTLETRTNVGYSIGSPSSLHQPHTYGANSASQISISIKK